jgi:hypothetical protein
VVNSADDNKVRSIDDSEGSGNVDNPRSDGTKNDRLGMISPEKDGNTYVANCGIASVFVEFVVVDGQGGGKKLVGEQMS